MELYNMHQKNIQVKKAKFIKTPWGKAEVIMTSKKGKTKILMNKERYKHLTNQSRD